MAAVTEVGRLHLGVSLAVEMEQHLGVVPVDIPLPECHLVERTIVDDRLTIRGELRSDRRDGHAIVLAIPQGDHLKGIPAGVFLISLGIQTGYSAYSHWL